MARLRPVESAESRTGPVAVLAAPAGELHAAGLACLAQVLEEDGWQTENLGANVPADDLVRFLSHRTVDLLGLSIGTRASLPALIATIAAIRTAGGALGSLPIMVGGHGFEGMEGDLPGADLVSTSLVASRRFVASLVVETASLAVETAADPGRGDPIEG